MSLCVARKVLNHDVLNAFKLSDIKIKKALCLSIWIEKQNETQVMTNFFRICVLNMYGSDQRW
jgi:hypothetical protein